MTTLPRILVPAAPIATVAEKTIYLLIVELWANQVCVRLAGVPTWRDDPDPEATPTPVSDEPSGLATFYIEVTDDVGTRYQMTSGQTGSNDIEWRADWFYRPGAPTAAQHLLIGAVSEPDRAVQLPLH